MLKSLKDSILSIGKSITEPVFLKEYETMDKVIEELKRLKTQTTNPEIIHNLDMDILYIKQGDIGEKNVYFELKNSFLPMYVLHDLRIQHDDYNAQLDFVIITSKFICILETKKLNGDITINNEGEFIRTFKNQHGKIYKKEGMYSPVSQNQRHVRILQDMLIKEKVIKSTPFISLVVMANPKNIINFSYTPKDIRQQIKKYDQLTSFLKKKLNANSEVNLPVLTMKSIGEFLLQKHVETENTFIKKYQELVNNEQINHSDKNSQDKVYTKSKSIEEAISEPGKHSKVNNLTEAETEKTSITNNAMREESPDRVQKIRDALIDFRKRKAKDEGIAAYYIFNNNQMEDLINKLPKDKAELLSCNGFGPAKVEKYGDSVLSIINAE